jgi:hypothetical protein
MRPDAGLRRGGRDRPVGFDKKAIGTFSTQARQYAARTQLAKLTAERDTALDEVAGLRAALRQMTRQQNALR